MSRKVRERAEMKWWGDLLDQHKIQFSSMGAMTDFIEVIIDHLEPQIMRTADEKMAAAREKILEAIGILEEGAEFKVGDALEIGDLDPKNRSDYARTRMFMKECGLLTHKPGEPEQWIKRITGPGKAPGGGPVN